MDAAARGHHECLSVLLAHGADPNHGDEVSDIHWARGLLFEGRLDFSAGLE